MLSFLHLLLTGLPRTGFTPQKASLTAKQRRGEPLRHPRVLTSAQCERGMAEVLAAGDDVGTSAEGFTQRSFYEGPPERRARVSERRSARRLLTLSS